MEKKIVELFAGVGGFRLGFDRLKLGWETVWFSQWEPGAKTQWAHECYVSHFGDSIDLNGEYHTGDDISSVNKESIPNHTLLVGGFPCQDYSVARSLSGSKGIEGKKGVLWWQIVEVLKAKNPPFCIFENVDRLLKSPAKQRGRDFGVMLACLNNLGYYVEWRVVNAAQYGAAQRRRRVFIFSCKKDTNYYKNIDFEPKDIISKTGFMAKSFPVKSVEEIKTNENALSNDLLDVSDNFKFNFEIAGFMDKGIIYTAKVEEKEFKPINLGDILQKNVDESFYITDDRDVESIYNYAKRLENMTFNQILSDFKKSDIKHYINFYDYKNNKMKLKDSFDSNDIDKTGNTFIDTAKGQLGDLVERFYFGYTPNSNQEADFEKVGMELKVTPIDEKKTGGYRAGERLSITNISYEGPVEEDFYKSHVYNKIKCILLVQYLRDKSLDRYDYIIKFVNKFMPLASDEDAKIIIDDYKKIINKIKQGKAHELSEGDTLYLGACTKGSTAADSWRPQYYGNHELAKKRNFCLKVSYMDYVLQNYVMPNKMPERIITEDIGDISFEDYIISKIKSHIGDTDNYLCKIYKREYNNNKAQWNDLVFRMLGVKSNQAEEFVKANIVVKTIRIEENGKNKESMSFPTFKFKELVEET